MKMFEGEVGSEKRESSMPNGEIRTVNRDPVSLRKHALGLLLFDGDQQPPDISNIIAGEARSEKREC